MATHIRDFAYWLVGYDPDADPVFRLDTEYRWQQTFFDASQWKLYGTTAIAPFPDRRNWRLHKPDDLHSLGFQKIKARNDEFVLEVPWIVLSRLACLPGFREIVGKNVIVPLDLDRVILRWMLMYMRQGTLPHVKGATRYVAKVYDKIAESAMKFDMDDLAEYAQEVKDGRLKEIERNTRRTSGHETNFWRCELHQYPERSDGDQGRCRFHSGGYDIGSNSGSSGR